MPCSVVLDISAYYRSLKKWLSIHELLCRVAHSKRGRHLYRNCKSVSFRSQTCPLPNLRLPDQNWEIKFCCWNPPRLWHFILTVLVNSCRNLLILSLCLEWTVPLIFMRDLIHPSRPTQMSPHLKMFPGSVHAHIFPNNYCFIVANQTEYTSSFPLNRIHILFFPKTHRADTL